MNRKEKIVNNETLSFYEKFLNLHKELDDAFLSQLDRSLPLSETLLDRWDRAKKLGFGENCSIYDSAVVFGKVKVGNHVWIGPNTIIDGSGGLQIGNYCNIGACSQIYTHDSSKQLLTSFALPIERKPVSIGNNVHIAPSVIITKGVSIGNFCIIGACSLVTRSVPDYSIVMGQPAKVVGNISFEDGVPVYKYL